MLTRFIELVGRIKSPQLYQLSYRPKFSKLLGKVRTAEVLSVPIVPVVYPTGASMSTTPPFSEEDMGDLWRRVTCP